MKLRWCDRSLLAAPLYYTVCTTEEMFKRHQRYLGDKEIRPFLSPQANATTHFISTKGGDLCALVCMPPSDRDGIIVAGILVHEAVHIWQAICRAIGEDQPSDEFEAYSIQWIVHQLLSEYSRQGGVLARA